MHEGREPHGRLARMQAASNAAKHFRDELETRLDVTTEAFRQWLIDLDLHEPRLRRS
jgi:hypothetical protein